MQNFTYQNPTKILFGKGSIPGLAGEIGPYRSILLTYGGGSIFRNGVYDQVIKALQGKKIIEFGGIRPNPEYDTCMKAIRLVRDEQVDFILSAGGGSILDASKFIAAAAIFAGGDPWDICEKSAPVTGALPVGCVLTLPATGSEMNRNAVISRADRGQKLAFSSLHVMPVFSILDPETTFSLDSRQTGNGVVDAFVHVMEQYLTYPVNSPLQDRMAEGILLTLIEEGPKVLDKPDDYDSRANIMWCGTLALNHLIGSGVVQDWTTHMIGHELTVRFGLDHAQTLAIVLPAVMRHQRVQKAEKIKQYGKRVWALKGSDDKIVNQAIQMTIGFFERMGLKTRLSDYSAGLSGCLPIGKILEDRNGKIGERLDIGALEVEAIFRIAE